MSSRIIRVFPRRTSLTPTDSMAFVGDPPLFRPEADEVHISATFTWDLQEAQRLVDAWKQYYNDVQIGGPALDAKPNGFISGMYVKQGVSFTSRGCNNNCSWCLVPKREGELTLLNDFAEGYIVNDNNFLQCPASHRAKVYQMLNRQSRGAVFAGGLQALLTTDDIAEELRGLRKIGHIFLAADTGAALGPLERAVKRLSWLRSETEIARKRPAQRLHCYALIGYGNEAPSEDDTEEEAQEKLNAAEQRLRRIWEIGATPFAQLYQPADHWIDYSQDWKNLARTWQRPALMMRVMGSK